MSRLGGQTSPTSTQSNVEEYKKLKRRVGQLIGLDIKDLPPGWSPSTARKTENEAIHAKLQPLWFKARVPLEALIETLTSRREQLSVSSLIGALEGLYKQTFDPIKQPIFTPRSSVRTIQETTTNIPGYHDASPFNSNAGSFASTVNSSGSSSTLLPETAQTSFASVNPDKATEFGSSRHQETQEEVSKLIDRPQRVTVDSARHITRTTSISPPVRAKRRSNGSRVSDVPQTRQESEADTSNDSTFEHRDIKRQRRSTAEQVPQHQHISHQIRSFPMSGFGIEEPTLHDRASWPLKWELLRAKQMLNIAQLDHIRSVDALKSLVSRHTSQTSGHFEHSNAAMFRKEHAATETPTLTASMLCTKGNKGPLFTLRPRQIKLETSCRAQRRYGWHRFLYVDIESRKSLPSHLKRQEAALDVAFKQWLEQPCKLLGRTWRAFHLQGNKNNNDLPWRVVFFATEGPGLQKVPLHEFLLVRLLQASYNAHQPACKAFSRVDLALSRTNPTITFEHNQIRMIDDILPSSTSDHDPFLDTTYRSAHRELRKHDPDEAMTDGCARISVGALKLIYEILGLESTTPSAFQARIFGSKGVWYASTHLHTTNPDHLDIWIEIRPSQLKVRHGEELFGDDDTSLSFDVVKHSHPPRASELHRDFLGILEDRGVARKDISDLARQSLDEETDAMIKAINDPHEYALLLQKHVKPGLDSTNIDTDEMPWDSASRLVLLLRNGGFMPRDVEYVGNEYMRMCTSVKIQALQKIRIPCPESMMLLGIAHHTDLVPPGKVHISLSEGVGAAQRLHLAGRTVLVARDPTLRASDIQKYECIFEPKLAHLRDVVVFSSQGSMPAAAKHQGGDYDGDTFWVCWREAFTSPFKNTPVLETKSWEDFGIKKDTASLGDFAESDGSFSSTSCDRFLSHAFEFKYRPSLLGFITNQHYALTYRTGHISSATASNLADAHDHLNDEAKNGYTYSRETCSKYMKRWGLPANPEDPLYKKLITKLTNAMRDTGDPKKALLESCRDREHQRHNDNIVDELYCNVLLERAEDDVGRIAKALIGTPTLDLDLSWQAMMKDGSLCEDLLHLVNDNRLAIQNMLRPTVDSWGKIWNRLAPMTIKEWYQQYRDLKPPEDLSVTQWRNGMLGYTTWECIRARALFDQYHNKSKMVFWLDKGVFCHLKANSRSGRSVLERLGHPNVRRPKVVKDSVQVLEDATNEFDNIDSQFDLDDLLTDEDLEGM